MNLIAAGNTADIYVHEGKIVKLYSHASLETVQMEAGNQEYAKSLGLRVPEIFEVTEMGGKPALVMDQAPGEPLGKLLLREPSLQKSLFPKSIELQRQLHQIAAPDLPAMSDRLRRQIDATSLITPEEKHRFNEMLDEVGPETHLCHGDFHALNLMWDGEHLTIIDWMDASHGNPLMDTCRTYVIYLGIDQQIAEMYLDEYCRQSAQHRNDVLRWSSVIAGARLSERTENAQLLWDLIKLGLQ